MANNQIVPRNIGGRLAPWLSDASQTRLGTFVINYIRDHPDDVREMAVRVQGWVTENLPNMRNQALQMGESIGNRIIRDWQDAGSDLRRVIETPEARIVRENDEAATRGDNEDRTVNEDGELVDLIDENAEDPTSGMDIGNGGTKRPATEPPEGEPEAARIAGGGGGPNSVSKETPISPYPTLTYGLQETHTTILPWCAYMSSVGMTHSAPNVLEFRMTQPHDILSTELSTLAAAGTWVQANYNVPYNGSLTRDTATAAEFPATIQNGTFVGEMASWWTFWRKQYEYYTVLGCEWEITIDCPVQDRGAEIALAWDYNSHTDTAGASGNKTPQDQSLIRFKQYKGINWVNIPCSTDGPFGQSMKTLSGHYKPGQAKRNIQNDGDVKTWVATNNGGTAASPTLKEFLTLYLYRHELAYLKPATKLPGVNIQVKLKYIVQFKDLLQNARYPNTTSTDFSLTIDADVNQSPI